MQIPWSTSLESLWQIGKFARKWIGIFQSISFTWNVHTCACCTACLSMPRHASHCELRPDLGGFFGDGGHSDNLGGFSRSRWILSSLYWHRTHQTPEIDGVCLHLTLTCAYYGQPLALIVIFERTSQNSTCSTCDPGSQTSVFHSAEWPDGWWQHCLY